MMFFLLFFSCAAGCASVRTADTRNVTVAVQNYNLWVSEQKELDKMTRNTFTMIGNHASTYNSEISKEHPDYLLLRENLAQDRQLLDQWDSRLNALTAATDRLDKHMATLGNHNATGTQAPNTLGLMIQYMKIYSVDVSNARQYLIEYVNNAETYIKPEDPDFWDDKYRQNAMQAKEQAVAAFADGDSALENITNQARNLQNFQ